MNYNELSRKGLIQLIQAFDSTHDNALEKYADETDRITPFERDKPIETACENIDKNSDTLSTEGEQMSEFYQMVDSIITKSINGFLDRWYEKNKNKLQQ